MTIQSDITAALPFGATGRWPDSMTEAERKRAVDCALRISKNWSNNNIAAAAGVEAIAVWATPNGLALAHMILADCTDSTPDAWIEAATQIVKGAGQ